MATGAFLVLLAPGRQFRRTVPTDEGVAASALGAMMFAFGASNGLIQSRRDCSELRCRGKASFASSHQIQLTGANHNSQLIAFRHLSP